jgi:hypothetical protein
MTAHRLAAAACGLLIVGAGVARPRGQSGGPAPASITFSEHVAPIVFAHCTPCHRTGEAAPFPLTSFADVRPMARRIATVTRSKLMPPWKAAPTDYAFANARGLADDEITTIERWVAGGMLEGDRAKLPPLPVFADGWTLGPPDLVVKMPEPFDVPATGPDVYRSFVIPLNVTQDTWVRAVDFRPSARAVVHHSLFFLDATGSARERDAGDPLPGFAGGMGGGRLLAGGGRGGGLGALLNRDGAVQAAARGTGSLGGWTPGGQPMALPEGLAFPVSKGSDLILSTHFHPSGSVAREQSTVGLYLTTTPPQQGFAGIQLPPLFGALEGLDIPAGDAGYTIEDTFTLPIDVRAFQVGAHAHYRGKEMILTATLPDGASRTLLWIKDWDFSWQEQYRFRDLVTLPKGTVLHATVRYDNSAGNPRNPVSPPVRVTWGEESADEMGSISLQVVAARPAELPTLRQAYADHLREAALSRPGLRRLLERGRRR